MSLIDSTDNVSDPMAEPMVNAIDGTTSRLPWRGALVHGVGAACVAVFCYSTARLVPSLPEPYWWTSES